MSRAKALLPSTNAWESFDGIFGDLIRGRLDFATFAEGAPQADSRIASETRIENTCVRLEVFMGSPWMIHSYDDPWDVMFHRNTNLQSILPHNFTILCNANHLTKCHPER